ncbi:MAG: hypothetical protein ACR2LI_14005 [Propionibacteriaceae bacterium]
MSSSSYDHRSDDSEPTPAFLAEVRAALADQDAVPRRVVEAGYAAFAWRSIDAELAELLYDSATQELATSGSRSDQATVRAMTFASEQANIELEVHDDAVLGQIVPALSGDVVVIVDGEPVLRRPVDEVGVFRLQPVPTGTFRLRFEGAGTTILTGPITAG